MILSRYRRARKYRSLGDSAHLHRPWDVWCKYQISRALPQGARSLTEEEEEEEDDDERIQKSRMRKICSSGNTKASTSLKGIA